MALDPVRRILVKPLTATTFGFWDVSDLATSRTIENREIEVVPTPVSSQIAGDARLYGLQYDPTLEAFVLWGGDSSVWVLHPPGNLDPDGDGIKDATAGWSLEKITPTGSGPTVPARFTGVFGKWVYLPAEKAYLGVIDPDSGDVYLYKPAYNVAPTVDTSPPSIQPNIVGTLGSAGWYRSDVQWTWSINDPESTVSDSTGCDPGSLSIDTTGQTFTCAATSTGGTTSQSITIRRDGTAPTASSAPVSLPNSAGWFRSNVTIRTTGTDATSGIASCEAETQVTTEGRDQTSVASTCTDQAGNVSDPAVTTGINIDKTVPEVTANRAPLPNASGWNNTPVTVSFVALDALSGVAPEGCDSPVTLQANGADQSITGHCSDLAGNVGTVTLNGIRIDTNPPVTVATATPPPNANGWNNSNVTVSFAATDSLPGSTVASCDCTADHFDRRRRSRVVGHLQGRRLKHQQSRLGHV